jgi:hypothetical protein
VRFEQDWTGSEYGTVMCSCEYGNKLSGSLNMEKLFEHVCDRDLKKKNPFHGTGY